MKLRSRLACARFNLRFLQVLILSVLVLLGAPWGTALAQVDPRPQLTAFDFNPKTINVQSSSATVNVTFTVTDAQSDAISFEMGFARPNSDIITRRGSVSFGPSGSFSGSVNVTFPQYAADGTWTAFYVLLNDAANNSNFISPIPTGVPGFPSTTALQVVSVSDTVAPDLTAFSFTPTSVNTTGGDQIVNVKFSASDNLTGQPCSSCTGVTSFQVVFLAPGGVVKITQSDNFAANTTITDRIVPVTIPQFSESGTWKVALVGLLDAVGNSQFLDTDTLIGRNFNTVLGVTSSPDTSPPDLTSLSFPSSIDTSSGAVPVTVGFAATDTGNPTASGVAAIRVDFISPSGLVTLSGTGSFVPVTPLSSSVMVNFPQFGELGAWKVAAVRLADKAGNVKVFSTSDLAPKCGTNGTSGACQLNVTHSDTTAPTVTLNSISPNPVSNLAPATVTLNFTVTDAGSGAVSFTATFTSPSGVTQTAGASFAPSASVTGTATAFFPLGSETGTWTVSLRVADAAGNVATTSGGTLTVVATVVDSTPPLIVPTVSPAPNELGWNNAPVTVTWTVADPESVITSLSGSGCSTGPTGGNSATVTNMVSPPTGSTYLVTTLTCSATSAGGTNSASVVVMIDTAVPVTSNVVANPAIVAVGTDMTLTATVTDPAGSPTPPPPGLCAPQPGPATSCGQSSCVDSAVYNVDDGTLQPDAQLNALPACLAETPPPAGTAPPDFTPAFDSYTENVGVTVPSTGPALSATGIRKFCVRGFDQAGNASIPVSDGSCLFVPVYDPNGGFATGGGAINSPAGADLDNLGATGKATFGFVSKYLPGSTTPSGNLEFQFKAGNLNFKSTAMELLVVTGEPRAQFTGTGTINGATVCKFDVDAWDASFGNPGVDAFGLRIKSCDNGRDRYFIAPTPLIQGSIVIHK